MKTCSRRLIGSLLAAWLLAPTAHGHLHLELIYRDGQLRLVYLNFDVGEAYPATALIRVGVPAAIPVSAASAFTDLLGEAGATVWVLPQSEYPTLPWLGIGAGGIRASDFTAPLSLALVGIEGPGHFALFFNDPFGQPLPVMNTRDGISVADTLAVLPGAHLRCNWAFSAPGCYRLTFVVSGILRAGITPLASAPTDWFFEVAAPPPPVLALAGTPTNTLRLMLQAHPGLNYTLERTATFTHWTVLTHLHAATPLTTLLLSPEAVPFELYRVRLR